MLKEIEGIIVKETAFKETSKIIQVLTIDGIISILAKGAKSLKSPYRAMTLKFTYAKFNIYYKKDKLSILYSVDVINNLVNIKSDIILISYLNYLTELSVQVVKQSSALIYNDYIQTILKLEQGLDPLVLTNILEIKYLDYLGVGLNLDACVECGSTTNIVAINADKGGFICCNCKTNEYVQDIKCIKLIRMYYYVDIKSIKSLNISEAVKAEINQFLNVYYDRYTGLYLHSKEFLKKLIDK